MSRGGLFGISTGRSPSNVTAMLKGLHVNTWSVVLNGAEAYDFENRVVAFPKTMTRIRMAVFLQEVLDRLPEVDVMVCTESRLFLLSPKQQVDLDFWDSHQPAAPVTMTQALSFPWLKILFRAPAAVLKVLEGGAARRGIFDICTPVYTRADYLELLPVGANKGTCLRNLRTMEELEGRTFVAAGDWTNDLELLQEADVPVAVENALPEVKALAKLHTVSNDEHALAHLIYHILPKL